MTAAVRSKVIAAVLAGVVSVLPAAAYACPVCFSTENEANRLAYLFTAIFMTLLPFVVVGGIALWIAHRARQAEGRLLEPSRDPEHAEPTAGA